MQNGLASNLASGGPAVGTVHLNTEIKTSAMITAQQMDSRSQSVHQKSTIGPEEESIRASMPKDDRIAYCHCHAAFIEPAMLTNEDWQRRSLCFQLIVHLDLIPCKPGHKSLNG